MADVVLMTADEETKPTPPAWVVKFVVEKVAGGHNLISGDLCADLTAMPFGLDLGEAFGPIEAIDRDGQVWTGMAVIIGTTISNHGPSHVIAMTMGVWEKVL